MSIIQGGVVLLLLGSCISGTFAAKKEEPPPATELEASVVAEAWPTSLHNIFCEAWAFHSGYSIDGEENKSSHLKVLGKDFFDSLTTKLNEKRDQQEQTNQKKKKQTSSSSFSLSYREAHDLVVAASPLESSSLFEYFLALRAYSPTCELHRSLARQSLQQLDGLSTFDRRDVFAVVYPTMQLVLEETIPDLDWKTLVPLQKKKGNTKQPDMSSALLPDEVVFGKHEEGQPLDSLIVLYANIGTPAFASTYQSLVDSNVPFVVRHLGDVRFEEQKTKRAVRNINGTDRIVYDDFVAPTLLQGYGVRLDMRNATDDEDDDDGDKKKKKTIPIVDVAADKDEVRISRHNRQLLDTLQDDGEIYEKMIVPEDQALNLPLQAAMAVVSSEDPLMALQEISQNLPGVASTLAQMKLSPTMQKIAFQFHNQTEPGELMKQLPSRDGTLLINGATFPIYRSHFNVFELLEKLKVEQIALEDMQRKLGPYLQHSSLLSVQDAWSMGADFLFHSVLDEIEDTNNPEEAAPNLLEEFAQSRINVEQGSKKAIIFVNDLEEDAYYAEWTKSLEQCMVQFQMGQPPAIRRNLFTFLAVLDPLPTASGMRTQTAGIGLAMQQMQNSYPARLGILMVASDDIDMCLQWLRANPQFIHDKEKPCPTPSKIIPDLATRNELRRYSATTQAIHRLFAHIRTNYADNYGGQAAQAYLEYILFLLNKRIRDTGGNLSLYDIALIHVETLKEMKLMDEDEAWDDVMDVLSEDEDFGDKVISSVYGRALRFAIDKGLKPGMSFMNGRPLPMVRQGIDEAESIGKALEAIALDEQNVVFGLIYAGAITDDTPANVYKYLLGGKTVLPKVYPFFTETRSTVETYADIPHAFGSESLLFPAATSYNSNAAFVVEAVVDFQAPQSIEVAKQVVSVMDKFPTAVRTFDGFTNVTVAYRIIPRTKTSAKMAICPVFAHAADLGARSLLTVIDVVKKETRRSQIPLETLLDGIPNLSESVRDKIVATAQDPNGPCCISGCTSPRGYPWDVETVRTSELDFITANGRQFNMEKGSVEREDINVLLLVELQRAKSVTKLLQTEFNEKYEDTTLRNPSACDSVARVATFLAISETKPGSQRISLERDIQKIEESVDAKDNNPLRLSWNTDRLPGEKLRNQVTVLLDPATLLAQRLSTLLLTFRDHLNFDLSLVLIPRIGNNETSTMPIDQYYRFVAYPHPEEGAISLSPKAHFTGIEMDDHVLSARIDFPELWDVEEFDMLDDAKKKKTNNDIAKLKYGLKGLVFYGRCFESNGVAPSGLQLTLTEHNSLLLDSSRIKDGAEISMDGSASIDSLSKTLSAPYAETIVIDDYWQMQAYPGVWDLELAKDSKGPEIFEIVDVTVSGNQARLNEETSAVSLTMKDFVNKGELLIVQRKPGHAKSYFYGREIVKKEQMSAEDDVINVFSTASGLATERFLKTMMLSVTKRTNSKVRFWFLENFLSSNFKSSVKAMSRKIGCEVEFVRYHWPEWLTRQPDKMRIMWGYKMLFLDVLFPLDLKKVIVIDASQVVQGDVKELWDMDMEGAAYGFPPFCEYKNETGVEAPYWHGMYWLGQLEGKAFHNARLFVVDLQKYRKKLTGELLRVTYETLAADPKFNQEGFLDQDLVNFAQHDIRIFPLPEEWSWCETWCSSELKTTAKNIDLCFNPLHADENVVEMAKRVVGDDDFDVSWEDLYDEVELYENEFFQQ